ncbi:MAG: hypothetical protein DRP09_14050 [Candidatus Thorarchaeota archaeon]|nr:MAG: hypothetical protein DRP09_14050 [Candidatus Thorarchaeota archaeon]
MFKRIVAKNLFSWKNLDQKFSDGITLFTGYNLDDDTPEGSGKSSIFNIISWTLYGKVPKDSVTLDEVITEGEKSAVGEVHFQDGTIIRRTRKPNDLVIVVDGKESRGKDAKETKQFIIDAMGMDYDTYCQCVYFAQNYHKRFITAPEEEKGKILSEVQDLTSFDRARKIAHERSKAAKTEWERLANNRAAEIEIASGQLESLEILEESIHNFESAKEDNINNIEIDLKVSTKALKTVDTYLLENEASAVDDDITHLGKLLSQSEKQKVEYKTSLRSIASEKANVERNQHLFAKNEDRLRRLAVKLESLEDAPLEDGCPTCGAKLTGEKLKKVKQKRQIEITDIQSDIDELTQERDSLIADMPTKGSDEKKIELESLLAEIQESEARITKDIKELEKIKYEILGAKKDQRRLCLDIERFSAKLEEVKATRPTKEQEQVQKLTTQMDVRDKSIKKLTKKIEQLETLSNRLNLLKSGFREVKAHIFRTLLKELSKRATRISSELFDIPVKIKFDNTDEGGGVSKINTRVTINGEERGLGLFSGGQAKRIQLAVDMALSQIVANRSQNPINFRILDESMQNLSTKSIEKVLQVLEKLPGTTLVVEHNELIETVVDKKVNVILQDGISTVE